MKLENYITREGSNSKLIYKKDFEEFLSIPNIRTILRLIDQIEKGNAKELLGTKLREGDLFVELIGGTRNVSYFKIGYGDKVRFFKDGKFSNSTGYDEVIWMEEVKQRLQGVDNVSVIDYKLGYKNENGRIITISDMLMGENIVSLGTFFHEIGVLQTIEVPKIGIDITGAIGYFLKRYNDEKFFAQLISIDKDIREILDKLKDFTDISTENILIDKMTGKLYLLDFMKL